MTTDNTALSRGAPPLALTNLSDVLTLGDTLARSGFFADARSAAQAVVKILAGRELGFGPLASMIGVHIIEGKPSVGSHLLAAAIRNSGRYDYQVVEHTDSVCAVQFRRRTPEGWEDLEPIERLTLKEAQEKGWTVSSSGKPKPSWQKTPKNMLFARVISNGYRFHCPDLVGGISFYDADELDAAPSPPPGEVIEVSANGQGGLEGNAQEPVRATPPAMELCSTEQVDRISALVERLGLSWTALAQRLQATYQVSSVGQLTISQADEVEAKLKDRARTVQPARQG